MNIKTIILVIIISILIGAGIYWFTMKPKAAAQMASQPREVPSTVDTIPSPSPLPSQPPIDKNTKLSEEAAKQTSPDFSDDYQKLKKEVDQNF